MKSTSQRWSDLGAPLGIQVIAPFYVELDGFQGQFAALLPQFGAPRGMIVDGRDDAIWPHRAAILAAGYGFSCVDLTEARVTDPPLEMLTDWGWTSEEPKPEWLGS